MSQAEERRYVLAVWLAAFAVRCLYVWQISHAPFFELRLGDAEAYDAWARQIAGGDWLGHDVFYQAPLYPYVLAVVYRVAGDSAAIVRIVQAAIGATSCGLLAAAGMSAAGDARGALAGALLAIYPPAIFLDGLLEKSSLVTFFTAALLALVATGAERMTPRRWAAAGVVLGLLALTRENALLVAVPLLAAIAIAPAPARSRTRAAAALATGALVVLVPVGLRNRVAGGELHLTTAQFGPNFYIGNHAGASGTYDALIVGHGSAADERADAKRLAEAARGRALTASEVSAYWAEQSLAFIRSRPVEWAKLLARKAALTFNAAEVSDTETLDVYAEWSPLLGILKPFDFGMLLALATLGTVLWAPSRRRAWLLYAVGGAYALSVILFYVFARYRFPIAPVLMTIAVPAPFFVRPSRRRLALGVMAAIGALAFANLPMENARAARAAHYMGIAAAMARDPARLDAALGFYERALDEAPEFPAAHFGLGTLLARSGRHADAVPHYRAALALWPDHAEAHYNLALSLNAIGQTEDAMRELEQAVRLRPDDQDARLALAKTLLALQRADLALEQFREAQRRQPRNVKALVGEGVALTELGRANDAIAPYQRALDMNPNDADAHNSLGYTLANLGRVAEALPHFERAVALNPGNDNAKRNLEQARRALSPR
jgi:tetratricopeptide (TPR) repeat protein